MQVEINFRLNGGLYFGARARNQCGYLGDKFNF